MLNHQFVRHADPQFGSAFGGACAQQVYSDSFGRWVPCGYPQFDHPTAPPPDRVDGDTRPQPPCCEFHDRGDEPCAPDDQGGYCCDNCPALLAVATAPKMLRETLCVAQSEIASSPWNEDRKYEHLGPLQRLINACDLHRPLGPDGKHGDLHTPTCGCEDVPACPMCGSPRWVAVSLDQGYSRRRQCVPCGAIWPGVIKDETGTGSQPRGGAA